MLQAELQEKLPDGVGAISVPRDVIEPGELVDIADPKLKAIGKRVLRSLQLEIEKAVANRAAPNVYPIPTAPSSAVATDPSIASPDVFAAWFDRMTVEKRNASSVRVMGSVSSPERLRATAYGDLARVDLKSATPVFDQVMALPLPEEVKTTVDYLKSLTRINGQIMTQTPLPPSGDDTQETPQQSFTALNKLELRVLKVACLDETDPEFLGDDEISMGGTTVDQSGITRKVSAFLVRDDFDTGESKVYSPAKRFTSFDLTAGGNTFPKAYFVTLVMAETDMGGLGDFLNALWNKTKGQVLAMITAAVGAAIGSVIPVPILGTIVGAVAGWVVGTVISYLIGLFGDDVFKPVTLSVTIPSLTHRFAGGLTDSPNSVVTFQGYGGKYSATVDWNMFS